MSIRTLNGLKILVEPFMADLTIKPSSDDGLHLAGFDKQGVWREFSCLSQALSFANQERLKQLEAVK